MEICFQGRLAFLEHAAFLRKGENIGLDSVFSELVPYWKLFSPSVSKPNGYLQWLSYALIRAGSLLSCRVQGEKWAQAERGKQGDLLAILLYQTLLAFAAESGSVPPQLASQRPLTSPAMVVTFLFSHSEPEWNRGSSGERFPAPLWIPRAKPILMVSWGIIFPFNLIQLGFFLESAVNIISLKSKIFFEREETYFAMLKVSKKCIWHLR